MFEVPLVAGCRKSPGRGRGFVGSLESVDARASVQHEAPGAIDYDALRYSKSELVH